MHSLIDVIELTTAILNLSVALAEAYCNIKLYERIYIQTAGQGR